MSRITFVGNPFEPDQWETVEDVDNVVEYLAQRYTVWPKGAKLYLEHVAKNCDVTPKDVRQIEMLEKQEGHFYVTTLPEGIEVILLVIALVLAAVSIGLSFLLRPNTNPTQQSSSPNNDVGNRQNQARTGQRIPDIYGTVRSTPDLIAPPYNVYNNNEQVQYSYMCVGRGYYALHSTLRDSAYNPLSPAVWDVKDSLTPISEEAGASVEIYEPFTSPNSMLLPVGTPAYKPQLTIGGAIGEPVWQIQNSSSVVGQIIRPPNDQSVTGNNSIVCDQYGVVTCTGGNSDFGSSIDFTAYFVVGDMITLGQYMAFDPANVQPNVDLHGVYEALDVTTTTVTFANPWTVNPNWSLLANFFGGQSKAQSATLTCNGEKWVGPFILNFPLMTQVWVNVVAPAGLYKISSATGNMYRVDVDVQIGIQAVDGNNMPIGNEVFFTGTCYGSSILTSQRAVTIKCVLPLPGSCQVRIQRTNVTDNTWQGTNADSLQWSDLYAVSPPLTANYGDVTTILSKTVATASALTAKERKLNLLVTRKLPVLDPITHLQVNFSMTATLATTTIGILTPNSVSIELAGYTVAPTGSFTLAIDGAIPTVLTPTSLEGVIVGTLPLVISGTHNVVVTYSGDSNYSSLSVILTYTVPPFVALAPAQSWGYAYFLQSTGVGINDNNPGTVITMYYGDSTQTGAIDQTLIDAFNTGNPVYLNASFLNTSATLGPYVAVVVTSIGLASPPNQPRQFYYFTFEAPTSAFYFFPGSGNQYYTAAYQEVGQGTYALTPETTAMSIPLTLPTDNAADIIVAVSLDPWIGMRSIAELDWENIYAVAGVTGEVATYFGTPLCAQFGFTFDDQNVSYEETLSDIAQSIFCTPYRRGSLIDISFEQPTDVGTVLFNHRNKIPGSETRTVQFGLSNDYDGIEVDYIDPNAPNYPDIDTTVTLYYPTDQSALSAKKVKLIGVRNNIQAALLGWRMYQKLLYQNTTAEFKATKEAADCVLMDSILVADNTRDDVMDGQVTSVNGLTLTLSQPAILVAGLSYYIFLQLSSGVFESIAITQGSDSNTVILAAAPSVPLNVDPSTWAQTTYLIAQPSFTTVNGVTTVTPASTRTAQMLLSKKKPEDKQLYALNAVNYDPRYYAHDKDFVNNILTENGTSYNGNGGYGGSGPNGSATGGSGAYFNVIATQSTASMNISGGGTVLTAVYDVTNILVTAGGTLYTTPTATLSGSALISGVPTTHTETLAVTVTAGAITAVGGFSGSTQWMAIPSVIIS